MIVWQRPNLLLLDEPTNHLDLTMREALALALNAFEGTVMLVSHDRALLRSVCDEFWLVGGGTVAPFDGDLDDYQRYLLDVARKREQLQNAAAASQPAETAKKPALSGAEQRRQQAAQRQQYLNQRRPLQKKIQELEAHINQLEAEKTHLENRLCENLPPEERAQAGKQLKAVLDAVERAESDWMEISEQLEALDLAHAQKE